MIEWLAIRLWAGKALRAAVGVFTRYPLQCALIAALALSGWLWRGWSHEATARHADADRFAAAQVEAEALAQRALAETERKYRIKAHEADTQYSAQLADARSATADYIRSHRVRAVDQGATGQAAAPAASGNPGVRPAMPADSLVAVSDSDVQACTDATVYAVRLREWALSLQSGK